MEFLEEATEFLSKTILTPSEQAEVLTRMKGNSFGCWKDCKVWLLKWMFAILESDEPKNDFYEMRRRIK